MSKYTKSAAGQLCQIRIGGVCNHNPETTVFAHLNGGGMGMKRADIIGSYACSACHHCVDGGYVELERDPYDIKMAHYEGMVRTIELMIQNGVLKL